jgi:hypothetical protein
MQQKPSKKIKTEVEGIEIIEVKGQRGNLISAQNMKMEADTVMDAISASDMGSMPDRSVIRSYFSHAGCCH